MQLKLQSFLLIASCSFLLACPQGIGVPAGYYLIYVAVPGVETRPEMEPIDPVLALKRYVLPYDYQFIGEFRKEPPESTSPLFMNSEAGRRFLYQQMQENPAFFTPE